MITVEVPVKCGGADHRVVLKVSTGRIRCVLADHDQQAENVLESLGSPPSACRTVRRAVTTLRSSIPYAIERALWLRIGVRDACDLVAWHKAGVRNPSVAERWLSFTDGALVTTWRGCGFRSPAQAAPWAKARFSPDGARLWAEAGTTVDEAIRWSAHGVAFATGAACWGRLGVRLPEETEPWLRAGVTSATDAEIWARTGISSPEDVRSWLRAGAVDAADALDWVRTGVHAEEAERRIRAWRRAGATSGKGAAAWTLAGVECGEVAKWRAEGLAGGKELILWRALGVESPEDLAHWREAGIVDGETARDWVKAGVRGPADLAAWQRAGVSDAKEAADWVWPEFVVNVDEVVAWKAAGMTTPQRARAGRESGPVPPDVRDAWLEGVFRLRPPGGNRPGESGPARPGACPTAVVTDRYYYSFWHPCRREVATDVIEIDFDAEGLEVSRCTRPLPRADRQRAPGRKGPHDT
jgi:rhodanese-related sulfurtransferase